MAILCSTRSLKKIQWTSEPSAVGRHTVVFSDLDIVGHVNNVKYMEWCIDASLSEVDIDRAIGEFEINFLHEALLGNHVEISASDEMSRNDGGKRSLIMLARREEDGQELIRARIELM